MAEEGHVDQPTTQPNGTGQGIDIESFDPSSLSQDQLTPERLTQIQQDMLRDYRRKTENVSNQRKEYETERERYQRELSEYREANQRWDNWYKSQDLDTYNQWLQSRQQPSGQPDSYDQQHEYMTRQEANEYARQVDASVQQRLNAYQQQQTMLMGLNDQLRDLGAPANNDPYDTYQLAKQYGLIDVDQVVAYARQNQLPDLRQAVRNLYSGKVIEKQIEEAKEAAYKSAREDAELEWKKRSAENPLEAAGVNRRIIQRGAESTPRGWGQATNAAMQRWVEGGGQL